MEFVLAREFTKYPGGRLRAHGDHSGEELREDHLIPRLAAAKDGLVVNLAGLMGLPPSFAEEAFGGLVRRLGPSVLGRITFYSPEIPERVDWIELVMKQAAGEETP